MPKFGRKSRERLETCHPDLQTLFNAVIEEIDCSVICGHRNKESQKVAIPSRLVHSSTINFREEENYGKKLSSQKVSTRST